MRELASVQTYSASDGREYIGNPNLVAANITSKDLRYEWYFGDDDYLSLTSFEKYIDNAIEIVESDQGDQDSLFSWTNVDESINKGFEFEIRKYLGSYWFISANATNISSKVSVGDELLARGQRDGRPMAGLSDEIYNFQVVFESDELTGSLAFNTFSKRLFANLDVSVAGSGEIYEDPFDSLDFSLQKRIFLDTDIIVIGFKARNILGSEKILRSRNGLIYDEYDVGQSFSLSVERKFF